MNAKCCVQSRRVSLTESKDDAVTRCFSARYTRQTMCARKFRYSSLLEELFLTNLVPTTRKHWGHRGFFQARFDQLEIHKICLSHHKTATTLGRYHRGGGVCVTIRLLLWSDVKYNVKTSHFADTDLFRVIKCIRMGVFALKDRKGHSLTWFDPCRTAGNLATAICRWVSLPPSHFIHPC